MDANMTITAAALRSRSESSFMVPTGAEAFWHLAVSHRSGYAFGVATGTTYDVPTGSAAAMVLPTSNRPMIARDGRTNAKQAGPPRGVPR
jgi:hypothetical protein